MKVDLTTYTYSELKTMAQEMGLKIRRSRVELRSMKTTKRIRLIDIHV